MVHSLGKILVCSVVLMLFVWAQLSESRATGMSGVSGEEENEEESYRKQIQELSQSIQDEEDLNSVSNPITSADLTETQSTISDLGDRIKKSVMGLFGLVTQKPHHKTETDLIFPPPRDAFLSTRGKKESSSSSVLHPRIHFQQQLTPMQELGLGLKTLADWQNEFGIGRGQVQGAGVGAGAGRLTRVRGVNSDYFHRLLNSSPSAW